MPSVLVTGGTGFLGSHLVRALAGRGDEVRVLSRREPSEPLPARHLAGDVRDSAAVERAVQGAELVVHLASNFRSPGADRVEARAINVGGTENVLRAARAAGVRHFVHGSTIGVHGDVLEIPATEETPYNPGDAYQETKLAGERLARRFAAESGLPLTVLRPVSIVGPGDRRMLKLFRMVRRGWFIRIGRDDPLFHASHVDDVVRGFLLCLENRRALGEVFLLGNGEYVRQSRLVALIADELGVRCRTLTLPPAPVTWLAAVTERAAGAVGVEPPLHRRRLSFYRNNRAFSIAKAQRVLGYEARIPLREALRRTASDYRARGWL